MPTTTRTNTTNCKITEHNVDGDVCDKCRRAYSAIYNVPEDVWLKIAPHPESLGEHNYGGGMLCPDCAATAAKAIGIRLVFVGERWEDSPAPTGKETELNGCAEACETGGCVMPKATEQSQKFSYEHYDTLKSMTERAQYLLTLPITAKVNIKFPDIVMQAFIADEVQLPFSGKTEEEAIRAAREWLEELAEGRQ